MILLIDTHVFIWWTSTSSRLKPHIIEAVADASNQIFVSPVSILEIATKRRIRKLDFTQPVITAIDSSGFAHLPILPADAEDAGNLVWDHKDPFDRLLVAQTARLGATLVTADAIIRNYNGISVLWAG